MTGTWVQPRLHFYVLVLVMVAGIVFSLAMTQVALAQAVDPSDRVHDIAKQLNCPTCAGRNLADCPTDTCMQWKQEIRSQIDAGKTNQEVIAYFEGRFGATVLQEPPKEGPILALWLVPIVMLVGLVSGGIIFLRRISMNRTAPIATEVVTANAKPTDEYAARLEEEVGRT